MEEADPRLTHLDAKGKARMVDVGGKPITARSASAEAFVRMGSQVLEALSSGDLKKGDALSVAKIAGIMAAKRTHELIPLCHPLQLTDIDVELNAAPDGVAITATVKANDRTGVEMEALVAASVAALTVYDMCKSLDKEISIESVRLVSKSGGKSGDWRRGG